MRRMNLKVHFEDEENVFTERERELLHGGDPIESEDYSEAFKRMFNEEHEEEETRSEWHLKQIEKDLMPPWIELDEMEKENVARLTQIWLTQLRSRFELIRTSKKTMRSADLDPNCLDLDPDLDIHAQLDRMKSMQTDLFDSMRVDGKKMRKNSRLMLRFGSQLRKSFEVMLLDNNANNYWKTLSRLMLSLMKTMLRGTYFVQKSARLTRLPEPATFLIEADETSLTRLVQLDDIHCYLFLALFELKNAHPFGLNVKKSVYETTTTAAPTVPRIKIRKASKRKLQRTHCKLILVSLVRLCRLCSLIRESLTLKQRIPLQSLAKYIRAENDSIQTSLQFIGTNLP